MDFLDPTSGISYFAFHPVEEKEYHDENKI
jgi:hypothetical protein